MNTKEAKTVSASCFWSMDDAPIEKEREFADRFFVERDVICDPSKREFILDGSEDEKGKLPIAVLFVQVLREPR